MDPLDPASSRLSPRGPAAFALAALLAAGCAHVPPLVAASDPLSGAEHVRLGSAYEAQGLRPDAVAQYEAAVRRDSAGAEGWLALGNLEFREGRPASAAVFYRKALAAAPGEPAALNNLAMTILARDGDLPEAESLARAALRQPGPLRPYVLDTLANIRLRQRRYDEALDLVDLAEDATPPGDAAVREQLDATRHAVRAAAGG